MHTRFSGGAGWLLYGGVIMAAAMAAGCQQSRETATAVYRDSGERPLFNGRDLSGWTEVGSSGAWYVEDGVLRCNGQRDGYAWLSTDETYGDYVLTLEWKVEPEGNTGVFCRAPDREGRTSMRGFEVQIRDDHADLDYTDVSGAVFARIPASGRYSRAVGEWNHMRITCAGRHLQVELNGQVAVDADIDTIEPRGDDPPMRLVPDRGYIGLQNHGSPAAFRNIRIRTLE